MDHVVEWNVVVYLDEQDDLTRARSELSTKDTKLVGHGIARRNPTDRNIPEIGDELATARALSDLAYTLLAAVADIEAATHRPATITS